MILVDTSVLIDALGGHDTAAVRVLRDLIAREQPFYLTPQVVREVLQGARDNSEWRRLRRYLGSQLMVDATERLASEIGAARIYFDCRRRGLTVRSAADCVIAQVALEHDLAVLQSDRDYDAIRKVRPLRTLP